MVRISKAGATVTSSGFCPATPPRVCWLVLRSVVELTSTVSARTAAAARQAAAARMTRLETPIGTPLPRAARRRDGVRLRRDVGGPGRIRPRRYGQAAGDGVPSPATLSLLYVQGAQPTDCARPGSAR